MNLGRPHPPARLRFGYLLIVQLLLLALFPAFTASAAITPGATAQQIAQAIGEPSSLATGASFVEKPPNENATPDAVSDTALTSFPRNGATYGILTTGDANLADDSNLSSSSGADDGGAAVRGGALDTSILKVDFSAPAGVNCLTVEFQFLSEEYPEFIGSGFNDAFVAELDNSDWSITPPSGTVVAPNNFAFDSNNNAVSVNTSGPTAMSAGAAAGTTYDGATPLLQASTPITQGAHSVYFSIFDQGDRAYDSAVFLDVLSLGQTTAGACQPGATVAIDNVSLTTSNPNSVTGVTDVALANLPADLIPQQLGPTPSAPIGRAPIGRAPIGRAPIGRAPIGRAPIGRAPIGRAPIGRAPIGRAPIGRATLAEIPLNISGGWTSILSQTANYAGTPPQGVTLFQLFTDPNAGSIPQLDPNSPQAITLADLDIVGTPLENISILSFLLGDRTWNDITAPVAGWCSEWTQVSSIPCDTARTIFDTEAEGFPIDKTSLPLRTVGQVSDPSHQALFWYLTIPDLNITGTYLGRVKLVDIAAAAGSNLNAIVNCSGGYCTDASRTLRDAQTDGKLLGGSGSGGGTLADLGTTLNNATLSDLVLMVADPTALPWETLPLASAGFEAQPENNPTHFVDYMLEFDIGCVNTSGLQATVDLPDGFAYKPGSSTLRVGDGSSAPIADGPATQGNTPIWASLSVSCSGKAHVRLAFRAMPGFTVGTFGSTASVQSASVSPVDVPSSAPVHVTDGLEPGSEPATAATQKLYVGHLDVPGDTDYYNFSVPAGKTLEVTLSHLSQDYDLVLYAPDGSQEASLLRNPASVQTITAGIPAPDPGTTGVLPPLALEGIHLEPDRVVAGVSSFGGTEPEAITTTAVAGNVEADYTVQVSGHNGAIGDDPYVLVVRQFDAYQIPACAPISFGIGGVQATPFPTDPSDQTLYLVNQQALGNEFGPSAANDIMSKLDAIANPTSTPTDPALVQAQGLIVPVDANADVQSALSAYWSNPCSIDAANNVVRKVNDAVDTIGNLGNIKNVVIVGDDAIFPHAALPDGTGDGNENGFTGDTIFAGKSTHLTAAAASNMFLSDTPYASFHPLSVLGQTVYVPQVALGRLGGSGADISAALAQFSASHGVANPDSAGGTRKALETDYDFMTDMGQVIFDRLKSQVGATNAVRLFGNWTRTDFLNQFLSNPDPPDVVSANGHYDQYRMLPGEGNATGDTSKLVTTADVTAAVSLSLRVLFSIGCHFALDIPDVYAGAAPSTSDQKRILDWAQAYGQKGVAVLIGNLGYGIGDTSTIAFSEQIMSDLASKLDGSMSVGQGLLGAEQDYFSSLSTVSPYTMKVLQEVTLWGMPMYGVPAPVASQTAQPASPVPPSDTGQAGSLPTTTVDFNNPAFHKNTLSNGTSFYDVNGQTEATHPYPIMPKVISDLPAGGADLVAHGAVPLSLHQVEEPFNIAFANATLDRSSNEPAPPSESVYPLGSSVTTTYDMQSQPHQKLVVTPGEFASDDDLTNSPSLGTFARFDSSQWLVVYSSDHTDFVPPTITDVTVTPGSSIVISATVTDPGPNGNGIVRVVAQVALPNGSYQLVELHGTGDVWSATAQIAPSDARGVTVYAIDGAGNTAGSGNKKLGFAAQTTGDTTKPKIQIFTPVSGATYTIGQTVTESYACSDVTSPTIAVSCTDSNPGTAIDTSTPGAHLFTVTAKDEAGNTATSSAQYFVQYGFSGFFAPVDNLPTTNVAKAGSAVGLKWRIVDANGQGITDASNFVSVTSKTFGSCSGLTDSIETYSGSSGLQNLGNGYWQFNWQTKKAWTGSCREVMLNLRDGTPGGRTYRIAMFTFK